MGDWPVGDSQRSAFQGSSAVSPDPTANTFGAWSELVTSLPYDISLWDTSIYCNAVGVDGVMAFGLGAGGSEVTILTVPLHQTLETSPRFVLPLLLPAGQRLAAKAKFNAASAGDCYPDFHFYGGQSFADSTPRQRATTYGITNSSGAVVTTGAASDYGSWVEMTPSCNRIKQMIVCVQPLTPISSLDMLVQIDVGFGAAASETVLFSKLYTTYQADRDPNPNAIGPLPCDIPIGTRIAVRAVLPNNTGNLSVGVSLIGIT